MPELLQYITDAVREERLLLGVKRLLVGCSGGGDSIALVDVLARLAPLSGVELAVAHLHHGWRGAEADEHCRLAADLAAARGLPFFHRQVDLSGAAGSREEAARNARLEFFGATVAEWGAEAVALGHTADDQLETVILHLARGSGRRGLGGMRARGQVGELTIVRPLLGVRRAALRDYARGRGLVWGEDSTNDDISLSRNRLRRRLLGDLQQINPGAVDNVARAAALMREEEEWLDEWAARTLDELVVSEVCPGAVALEAAALAALPLPLRRRVVRRAIERVRGHCRDISLDHIEWVIRGDGVARDLPGVRVRREGTRIRLLPLSGRRLASPAI